MVLLRRIGASDACVDISTLHGVCAAWNTFTDVSEVLAALIIRVVNYVI